MITSRWRGGGGGSDNIKMGGGPVITSRWGGGGGPVITSRWGGGGGQ